MTVTQPDHPFLRTASALATDPCIHCGFCLPSCASYRVLGTRDGFAPRADPHAQGDRSR